MTKPVQRRRAIASVLKHQKEFVEDFDSRLLGLVGGFGCGKTKALVLKAIALASKNVGTNGALYSPTHTLAMDTLIPEMDDQLESLGIAYTYRASPLPAYTLKFPNGTTRILIRSFENWRRIRALNLSFACCDEIDVVDPKISRPAFKLLFGRIRVGKVRQIAVVSTPEGFGLMYETFVKEARGDRRLIHARSTDNPFLPQDFLDSLLENYPPNLIKAYLDGEFVNLSTLPVYPSFDRVLNHCNDTPELERLHIGMDFNIGKMAAVVHALRSALPRAVDEFFDLQDTTTMISAIRDRYPHHAQQRLITIYPDASGAARKTSASDSDITLLRQAGFSVIVNATNPAVKDRVNSMNAALCNGNGNRRYLVNTHRCPRYTEALEQQGWRNGEPDKTQGLDHLCDAGGYVISKLMPIAEFRQFSTGRSPTASDRNVSTVRQALG